MSWLEIDFQGQPTKVFAQKLKGQLWIHWQGQTFCFEQSKNSKRRTSISQLQSGIIKSPMPGKIISLLRKKGDLVQSGEVLVVIEAMKMEYSLKAESKGVIEVLEITEGQQVGLGQILLKIKSDQKEGSDE